MKPQKEEKERRKKKDFLGTYFTVTLGAILFFQLARKSRFVQVRYCCLLTDQSVATGFILIYGLCILLRSICMTSG